MSHCPPPVGLKGPDHKVLFEVGWSNVQKSSNSPFAFSFKSEKEVEVLVLFWENQLLIVPVCCHVYWAVMLDCHYIELASDNTYQLSRSMGFQFSPTECSFNPALLLLVISGINAAPLPALCGHNLIPIQLFLPKKRTFTIFLPDILTRSCREVDPFCRWASTLKITHGKNVGQMLLFDSILEVQWKKMLQQSRQHARIQWRSSYSEGRLPVKVIFHRR